MAEGSALPASHQSRVPVFAMPVSRETRRLPPGESEALPDDLTQKRHFRTLPGNTRISGISNAVKYV